LDRPIVSYHPGLEADINLLLVSQRPLERRDRQAMLAAGAVLLPQVCRRDLFALASASGRPLFPNPAAHLSLDGKVGNLRLFTGLGLPHPPSVEFRDLEQAAGAWEAGRAEVAALGAPLVAKGAGGGMGTNVFLVDSPSELRALAGRLDTYCARGPSGLVLQRYVPGISELRVELLHTTAQVYWRRAAGGEFRANLYQGGTPVKDGPPQERAAAVALAKRLQREARLDVAGVDVIFPPGGEPLLLELNFFFGRRALGGSETFLARYLKAVRSWLSGQGLDPSRVRLAEEDL
jgi:ribosomal protein S6--L-glutamate ligase